MRIPPTFLACLIGLAGPVQALDHPTVDDLALAVEDRPVAIDVIANDPGVGTRTTVTVAVRPRHGTARTQGREIVYTPAAGFAGRDRLSYLVKTGRRVGMGTVTVDVGPAQVTLAGRMTDAGAHAQVSAVAGQLRFTAQADGAGNYVLPMSAFDDDMVRLQGRRGEVALASIVGTLGRLRDDAGADTILTREENARVQLTRLSTPLAYLLQLANAGTPPADDPGLEQAHAAVDINILLQMAAAIDLVATQARPLPVGVADTLELISEVDAFRQFLADVATTDPEAIDESITALLSDSEVLPPVGRDSFIGEWTMVVPSAPETITVGVVFAQTLQLAADGGGRFSDSEPAAHSAVSWTFVAGEARAELFPPRRSEYVAWRDGAWVQLADVLDRIDFVLLAESGVGSPQLFGARYHRREITLDPPYGERSYVATATRLAFGADVPGIPFLPSEFPGSHALPVHRPERLFPGLPEDALGASNYGVHAFSAGGTGTLDDGQAFQWSLAGDGRLSLDYGDGDAVEFRRLQTDGRKGTSVVADYLLPGGRDKVIQALSSERDGSLVFPQEGLAGPWRSGFDVSRTDYDSAPPFGFYVILDPVGGTGRYVSITGTGTTTTPIQWEIVSGAVVIRQFSGAQVARERRWIPVSRSGNRIYLHEELWFDPDLGGPASMQIQSQRANFYDREAPPG